MIGTVVIGKVMGELGIVGWVGSVIDGAGNRDVCI